MINSSLSGYDPSQDAELLQAVAAGDETAFARLAYIYSEKVLFHALTFVKSYPVAEEMVQDIFLKVWNQREKLREVVRFDNYLFVISKNYLISALRRKLLETDEPSQELPESFLYRPDALYETKELGGLVDKGLSLLPEQRRKVFRMIRLEGLTQDQVSEKLGIAPRTVRWNLVMATNFLQDFLNQHLPDVGYGILYLYPVYKLLAQSSRF